MPPIGEVQGYGHPGPYGPPGPYGQYRTLPHPGMTTLGHGMPPPEMRYGRMPPQGPGIPKPGYQGPGIPPPGMQGPGGQGPGIPPPGMQGPGMQGPGIPTPVISQGPPGAPQPQMSSFQAQQPTMSREMATIEKVDSKHIPLARCRVLYLGSAVPVETAQGLEAVQAPLRERYQVEASGEVAGIDAWATVYSSGLQMQYVADRNTVTWFPVQSLHVCAAVKCVNEVRGETGEGSPKFVALDSPAANNSSHPPMFCSIMRRTKGVKVLECHSFIAKSYQAAMAMVQAITHAYEHKEGWTDEPPPSESTIESQNMHLVPGEMHERDRDPASKEFFDNPPPQGYFYATSKDLVKNYNVYGGKGQKDGVPPPRMPQYGMGPMPPRGPPIMIRPPPMRFGLPGPPPMMMGGRPPMMMGPPPPGAPGLFPPPFMPPPPPGYFNDWDGHGGPMFIPPLEDIYGHNLKHKKGRSKSRNKHKKHNQKSKQRMISPQRQLSPRRQRRSPSPYRSDSSADDDLYHGRSFSPRRRSLSPEPDYGYIGRPNFPRGYERGGSQSDLIVFRDKYDGPDRHDRRMRSMSPPRSRNGNIGIRHESNFREEEMFGQRDKYDVGGRYDKKRNIRSTSPGFSPPRSPQRSPPSSPYNGRKQYDDALNPYKMSSDYGRMGQGGERNGRMMANIEEQLGFYP